MKLAAAPGTAARPYTCETISNGDIISRHVICLHHGCVHCAHGDDRWWFGTVDEHTHLYALRCELARQCNVILCPHQIIREGARL